VGTTNQTASLLGTFADPAASGWQVYHWIPLLDTNGNQVIVGLGGKATLRLASGNNLNFEFFMLAPAPLQPFGISAVVTGSNIQISIPTQAGHSYTLWHTGSLLPASWSQVGGTLVGDGTVQVVPQSLTGYQGYYRVMAQ